VFTSVVEGNVQALEGGMELEHRAQRQHSCVCEEWGEWLVSVTVARAWFVSRAWFVNKAWFVSA
jgi:hypothetical protein